MGRKSKVEIIIAFSLFSFVLTLQFAQADPLYYAFTGIVEDVSYDPGGASPALREYISAHPLLLQVATPVFFLTLIDFSREPAISFPLPDPSQIPNNAFYAQYILGPSPTANLNFALFNNSFGVDSPSGWMVGVKGSLFANPLNGADFGDSPFKIYSYDKIVSQWTLGDGILGRDQGAWGHIDYELNLSAIVSASAVPEPSTMLLLGSGLVGIIGFRRRLKK
jgi:hypothetical protein